MNNPYAESNQPMHTNHMSDPFMPQDIKEQKLAQQNPYIANEPVLQNGYTNPYGDNNGTPPQYAFVPPPAPVMMAPVQPQVIYINNRQVGLGQCPYCKSTSGVIHEKKPGVATWSWCVVGCLLGGVCCFWIPFVVDDCYDHVIRCTNCHQVRQTIRSDFCCCD